MNVVPYAGVQVNYVLWLQRKGCHNTALLALGTYADNPLGSPRHPHDPRVHMLSLSRQKQPSLLTVKAYVLACHLARQHDMPVQHVRVFKKHSRFDQPPQICGLIKVGRSEVHAIS